MRSKAASASCIRNAAGNRDDDICDMRLCVAVEVSCPTSKSSK